MKQERVQRSSLALDRSSLAYRRLQEEMELLPSHVHDALRKKIADQLSQDDCPAGEFRRRELTWMTTALVCAHQPELRRTSQHFLRTRQEYLNQGGSYGKLSDFR